MLELLLDESGVKNGANICGLSCMLFHLLADGAGVEIDTGYAGEWLDDE